MLSCDVPSVRAAIASICFFSLGLSPTLANDGISPNQILIGQTISLQGGKNEYGVAVQEGVKLHLDAINSKGGVFGRKIELKTLDDDANSGKAESNARALVDEHKVFVLFGSIEGGPSTAVMKVATEAKVPFIGPMAGAPTLRTPHNPLVFPVRAEHKEEFKDILRHASGMGLKRVGFMRSSSEVGALHLANVKKASEENKLQFVADLPFGGDVTDAALDAMVQQIEEGKVEVVLNHGGIGAYERLIRKVRAKGLPTVFYGVNSGSSQLATRLGPLAAGMGFAQVVPNPRVASVALTRVFRAAYAEAHPTKTPSYGTLEGYMTARVLVEALKKAGPKPSRETLVAALRSADINLDGFTVSYRPGNHAGLTAVDLSVVTREGTFRH